MKIIYQALFSLVIATLLASCAHDEIGQSIDTTQNAITVQNNVESNYLSFLQQLDKEESAPVSNLELRSQNNGRDHRAYLLSNEASDNKLIVFTQNEDGTLTESDRISTGGTGTDAGLGNQGAIALDEWGKLLVAVNPGSNDISLFVLKNSGDIILKDKINSGGLMPISVTISHGLIYVLNAGGTGNISGFAVDLNGMLIPISYSTRALSTDASGPAQISFSPNGKVLVITEKATNTISSFYVGYDSRPGRIKTLPSAGVTPFGFSFGNGNIFYVSEASGGNAGASTVSSYEVDLSGIVRLLDGPFATHGSAACWVAVTNNGKSIFATNTGGNDVSSLSSSSRGNLSFANGGNTTPAMSTPIDASVDRNSKYLYVLVTGTDEVLSYKIGSDGQLTQIDADGGLPNRATGLVVR